MAFLLGLTGNIACGKSTVGAYLREKFGADYVDADRVVHGLYAAGTPETAAIAARFGADLLQPDGTIDRRRLGDRVMADPAERLALEDILQPSIRAAIDARIAASSADVVVLDAIRLIEAGLVERCHAVWVVTCSPELQEARLVASRGLTADQARLRIAAQAPQTEKLRYATAAIENRDDLDALHRQIDEAWTRTVAPALTSATRSPA